MIPDFSGDYLNYDGSNDGDVATIIDEGRVEFNETLKKDMFNISVEVKGAKKTYSPNNKSGRALQEAFGKDTKTWVGKQFTILHIDKKMHIRPNKV